MKHNGEVQFWTISISYSGCKVCVKLTVGCCCCCSVSLLLACYVTWVFCSMTYAFKHASKSFRLVAHLKPSRREWDMPS